jgi:hypothetical protein
MPWELDGMVASESLRIEIPCSEEELFSSTKGIAADAMVSVSCGRPERRRGGWLAIGRLPVSRAKGSAQLRVALAEHLKPVVVRDKVLGKLVLDRSLDAFKGRVRIAGRRCDLLLIGSRAPEFDRARRTVAHIANRFAALLSAIAREMLPLYNDNWRAERRALGRTAFLARIRVSSITIPPSGRTSLFFRDGGLFYDHFIEVRLRPTGAISEICLAG